MIASEFARLLKAKKISKNKWIAKCPAHPDHTPSLSIGVGKKVPVLLRCMSQGCETKTILEAMGLKWSALFMDGENPELRGKLARQRKLERLERRLALATWLSVIDENRRYWDAAVRRIIAEMEPLYWEIMPERERFERLREVEANDYRIKRLEWLLAKEKYKCKTKMKMS